MDITVKVTTYLENGKLSETAITSTCLLPERELREIVEILKKYVPAMSAKLAQTLNRGLLCDTDAAREST